MVKYYVITLLTKIGILSSASGIIGYVQIQLETLDFGIQYLFSLGICGERELYMRDFQ